jgi:gluconolactonase
VSDDLYEIVDERFRAMVLGNAVLATLAEDLLWAEGPVWCADQQCLYVSDLPRDRILRWSEDGGVSVFRAPAGFPNGKCRDPQGRLVLCSHHNRWIERTEIDGEISVLASTHDGKRLNAPNDVVCKSDGTLWFTDPLYGIQTDYEGGKQHSEQPPAVYRLDPDGTLTVVADDFEGPNGLAFSPDETILYIAETGDQFAAEPVRHLRRFAVTPDDRLTGGEVFHTVSPGYADGFKVDTEGNLWTGAGDGVHCITPDGTLLGKIRVPSSVGNLVFGGRARSRLFLCASHALYAIDTNVRGCVRP